MGKRHKTKKVKRQSDNDLKQYRNTATLAIDEDQDPLDVTLIGINSLQQSMQSSSSFKCLICSRNINHNQGFHSNVDELTTVRLLCDLFKILRISPAVCRTLLAESLPRSASNILYCTACQETISNCLKISKEIDQLRQSLEELTCKIKEDFIEGYYCRPDANENDGTSSNTNVNAYIRKTLVQCWTTCRVQINKLSPTVANRKSFTKVICHQNADADADNQELPKQQDVKTDIDTESSVIVPECENLLDLDHLENEERMSTVDNIIDILSSSWTPKNDFCDDGDGDNDCDNAPLSPSSVLSDNGAEDTSLTTETNHPFVGTIDLRDKNIDPLEPFEEIDSTNSRRSLRLRKRKHIQTYLIDSDESDKESYTGSGPDSDYVPEPESEPNHISYLQMGTGDETNENMQRQTKLQNDFRSSAKFVTERENSSKVLTKQVRRTRKRLKKSNETNQDLPYKCDTCGKSYLRLQGLQLHQKYHVKGEFTCSRPECSEKSFATASHLQRHKTRFHKFKSQSSKSKSMSKLCQSEIRRWKLNSFECNYCQKLYKLEDYFVEPGNDRLIKIPCDQTDCSKTFTNFVVFGYHHDKTCSEKSRLIAEDVKNDRGKKGLIRKYCKASVHIDTLEKLETLSPCPCPQCGQKFQSLTHLNKHINRTCHSVNLEKNKPMYSHTCSICDKRYEIKFELNDKGQKALQCVFDYCNRWTVSLSGHRKHHKTHHSNDKIRYKCEFCEKEFSYIESSFLTDQGIRRFKCDFDDKCERIFDKYYNLWIHHQSHHKNDNNDYSKSNFVIPNTKRRGRPKRGNAFKGPYDKESHTCKFCKKIFKSPRNRQIHEIASHTKEFKYYCEICGLGRPTIGRLKEHVRSHSQQRPYRCELCPKTFKIPFQLKSHMNVHNNLRPYMCELCGRSYHNANTLGMHKKQSHKSQPRMEH